jgi:alpha-D-ribose 1-methylphosphonate 5-triphosphate synthase subunit PhnL
MPTVYGIRYDDPSIRAFFEERRVTICVDDIQIPITIEDDMIYLTDSLERNVYDIRNARDMARVIQFLRQIGSVNDVPSIYTI